MNEMTMKKHLFAGLTAALLLPAHAAVPLPVVVAESEAFEIVGRLDENSLVLHVDRAPTNAPVLGATLSVETGGKEIAAPFQAASGDYRIEDVAWLQPLRATGEHGLSFTLLVGDEADLLAGDLIVEAEASADTEAGWTLSPLLGGALLAGFGLAGAFWGWRRQQSRRGGAA
jgi:hypothetical protein